jgi:hypothetical protein
VIVRAAAAKHSYFSPLVVHHSRRKTAQKPDFFAPSSRRGKMQLRGFCKSVCFGLNRGPENTKMPFYDVSVVLVSSRMPLYVVFAIKKQSAPSSL